MQRRLFSTWLILGLAALARAAESIQSLRGKLLPGETPVLETGSGASAVRLTGDAGTMMVLADTRLKDLDFEVMGETAGPGVLRVGPIHKRSMFVHRGGQRLMITYWCEVCSIRTFTPGVCMCCQDETALDLKEKLESDDLRSK